MAAPSTAPVPDSVASPPPRKPIHSLVLDTGPLIKNDPSASALINRAEALYMPPCVLDELRDETTRNRVETTLLPFVTLRSPKADSLRFVQGFARRTGDLAVLSRQDLEVLALAYELECERNGGDWRLRNTPAQKRLNGRPPTKEGDGEGKPSEVKRDADADETPADENGGVAGEPLKSGQVGLEGSMGRLELGRAIDDNAAALHNDETGDSTPTARQASSAATPEMQDIHGKVEQEDERRQDEEADGSDSDDQGGWITPSNIKKHQAKFEGVAEAPPEKTLQAAMLTSDFAMQNVALRMNLNLVAPSLTRITRIKNWVLRCHGCFSVTKDMEKQFCPTCGQATLTRVSCSTDQSGAFRVHLKANYQWNKRGNVYSVPKPVHGSASGKWTSGGGKNGWGQELMLAEDQKEYARESEARQRAARRHDPMDDDYLPSILNGNRQGGTGGGRPRVGAGRNVNSRRRR